MPDSRCGTRVRREAPNGPCALRSSRHDATGFCGRNRKQILATARVESLGTSPAISRTEFKCNGPDADDQLACKILDALMVLSNLGAQHSCLIDTIVSHGCIPILGRYRFVDAQLARVYHGDGRRILAHTLWCKIVQFVSAVMRNLSCQYNDRGSRQCLEQVLEFISVHKLRLGIQWTPNRKRPNDQGFQARSPILYGNLDSNLCQVRTVASLRADWQNSQAQHWQEPSAKLVEALPSRSLSLLWLEEVEEVLRLAWNTWAVKLDVAHVRLRERSHFPANFAPTVGRCDDVPGDPTDRTHCQKNLRNSAG